MLAEARAYVHEDGRGVAAGDTLSLAYYEVNAPIVLQRLSVTAVRLAATLQFAFEGAGTRNSNADSP